MKKLTTKEWGKQFFVEWLLPKGAVAYAVYKLADILYALPQSGDASTAALGRLEKFFELTSGLPFFCVLLVVGVLWLLSLLTRSWGMWKKIRIPQVFKFAYMNGLFATAFGILTGMVLVPLSLAVTFVFAFPRADLSLTISIGIAVIAFVGLSAALHWAKFFDANPPHCVTYVIELNPQFKGEPRKETVDAIEHAIKDVAWVGTPAVLLESDDGQIVLAIPVRLRANHWSSDDMKRLLAALAPVEQVWTNADHTWGRQVSRALDKKVRPSGKVANSQLT
ncbi:hypothetical protein CJO88_05780 [Ralstonia solanacearum]|nr:hypothetical protein CJO88_05780 [Ralstonia solanacearum]